MSNSQEKEGQVQSTQCFTDQPLESKSTDSSTNQSQNDEKPIAKSTDKRCIAILAINFAMLSNVAASTSFKILALEGKVGVIDFSLLQNIAIVLIASLAMAIYKINPLKTDQKIKLIIRGLISQSIGFLILWATELITLSLLTVLYLTNPFFTQILSFFVNKEKIFLIEAIGMVMCFAAVIWIVLSDSDGSDLENEEEQEESATSNGEKVLGICIIMIAAALTACMAVIDRKMQSLDSQVLMAYDGFISIILILGIKLGQFFVTNEISVFELNVQSGMETFLLAFGPIIGAASVAGRTLAYQKAPAGFVSLISFIGVVYAMLSDILAFELAPNANELIGGAVILLVTVIIAIYKLKKERQNASLKTDSKKEDENQSQQKNQQISEKEKQPEGKQSEINFLQVQNMKEQTEEQETQMDTDREALEERGDEQV